MQRIQTAPRPLRWLAATLLVVGVAMIVPALACSDSDGDSSTDGGGGGGDDRCTPAGTETIVQSANMSALLESAVDDASRSALLQAVVDECCPLCNEATERPLASKTEACVSCAGGYTGGNPGEHITGCAATICD